MTPTPYLDHMVYLVGSVATFRAQLDEALAHGGRTHAIDDVLTDLLNGSARLFRTANAFMVVEIREFPRRKDAHIWLGGALPGHRTELDDLIPLVRAFAREHGCSGVTVTGRAGWERLGMKHGFEVESLLAHTEVANGPLN